MPVPAFRLVVGLGNPGRDYEGTRHNIGFMILDQLSRKTGFEFQTEARWDAAVARHEGVIYCKPLCFMNRSGRPARAIADFFKIAPSETLVVLDDAALPLGRLRLRPSGSAGGHNGLQSIIDHLGTNEVARLRAGIGAAEGSDMVNHVLGRFSKEETPVVEQTVARATDAIIFTQTDGLHAAMNRFNQPN